MLQELRASLTLLIFFTLLTGILYPLAVSGVGQTIFSHQAEGSLAIKDGTVIGSELIGQNFTSDKYFHSRPSAAGNGYDASNSSGSNLAPTSPDLIKTITARVEDWRKNGDARPIPIDLVTASASGLDPDISVDAATYQAAHVAEVRNISLQQVQALIVKKTKHPTFGILGENRVNVLALNNALDAIAPMPASAPATQGEAPAPMPADPQPSATDPADHD